MGRLVTKRMLNAIDSIKNGLSVAKAAKKHRVKPQAIYKQPLYKALKQKNEDVFKGELNES